MLATLAFYGDACAGACASEYCVHNYNCYCEEYRYTGRVADDLSLGIIDVDTFNSSPHTARRTSPRVLLVVRVCGRMGRVDEMQLLCCQVLSNFTQQYGYCIEQWS